MPFCGPPYYALRDAVDRLWTTAEVHGLVEEFGENIIQSELAVAFGKSTQDEQSDDLDAIALGGTLFIAEAR